jgi:hypothetical protein
MTRDEALTEIAVAVQQGLELTGEWGKVYYSKGMFGEDCYYDDPTWMVKDSDLDREYPLLRAEAVLRITDALERKIKNILVRYITLDMKSLVQICRWDYLANRLPDRIIGEGQDKLSALWDAWKELMLFTP